MIIGEFGLSGHMDQFDKQDLDKAFNYLVSKREEMIESMIYANAWYSLQYNKTKYRRMYPKLSAIKDYYVIKDVKDKEKLKSKQKYIKSYLLKKGSKINVGVYD